MGPARERQLRQRLREIGADAQIDGQRVSLAADDLLRLLSIPVREPCPNCQGRGAGLRGHPEATCTTCGGSGLAR